MSSSDIAATIFIIAIIAGVAHSCSTAATQNNKTSRMKACIEHGYSYENDSCVKP